MTLALEMTVAGIALIAIVLFPATVCALKRHWGLFVAGLVVPVVFIWWIGALKPAAPDSWWARMKASRRSEA
jgi:hypothetical protein